MPLRSLAGSSICPIWSPRAARTTILILGAGTAEIFSMWDLSGIPSGRSSFFQCLGDQQPHFSLSSFAAHRNCFLECHPDRSKSTGTTNPLHGSAAHIRRGVDVRSHLGSTVNGLYIDGDDTCAGWNAGMEFKGNIMAGMTSNYRAAGSIQLPIWMRSGR